MPVSVLLVLGLVLLGACSETPPSRGAGTMSVPPPNDAQVGVLDAASDAATDSATPSHTQDGAVVADSAIDGSTALDASTTDSALSDAETDAAASSTYDARALVGPSYQGSVNNSAACSRSYPTRGHEPVAAGGKKHPLFLYFVGTAFVANDPSATYESVAALAVTEAMAQRGFVALSVQYDNGAIAWLSDHRAQIACLFAATRATSLIASACALPQVDCDLGIATWGHSQGGYVAAVAHNVEPRVRAVWATGYGGDASETIARDRLRVVNGEADTSNGMATTLNMITGLTPVECPDPDQCLRADGSGWIIVRKADLALPDSSSADHCWFDRPSCTASAVMLEPNWVDPLSDKAFALALNADWVAQTLRR